MNAALLLTALFNGAWQGAVLCTLAVLAFRLFRRLNATTMFTVWSVLLAIAVLLPFANYAFAPKPYHIVTVASPSANTVPTSAAHQRQPAGAVTAISANAAPITRHRETIEEPTVTLATAKHSLRTSLQAVLRYAPFILIALALIALLRLAILARDVMRMLAARTRVRPIDAPVTLAGEIARPFRFAASDDFTSPCVLGFAPALIVIPEDLLAQPSNELTSVVLHEREHVRRFDDVQNVVQRFIGALAFFCPGVRIALRELALYREQICDDAAVNATGDRVSYAMTLTGLAQWAQGRGTPVPSLIFKRKHLLHRLEVLLDSAVSHSMRMNRRFATGAVTALVIAALLVLHIQLPVIAETVVKPAAVKPVVVKTHTVRAVHTVKAVVHNTITVPALAAKPQKRAVRTVKPAIVRQPSSVRHETKRVRPAIAPRERLLPLPKSHTRVAYAYAPTYRQSDAAASTAVAPNVVAQVHRENNGDLLDALNAAGMRDLPVDQLIELRDHGVNPLLVRSAVAYFGHVSADDLVYLSDHGVGPAYIQTLRDGGITGISTHDAVLLMDHGVQSQLIRASLAYFTTQRPGPKDLVYMADHGVSSRFLDSLRTNHVNGLCWEDTVNMLDHGVDAAYVVKIRRMNPRASISDIIRLHDAGF